MSHHFGMRCQDHGLVAFIRCAECGTNHGTTNVPCGRWCPANTTQPHGTDRAPDTEGRQVQR